MHSKQADIQWADLPKWKRLCAYIGLGVLALTTLVIVLATSYQETNAPALTAQQKQEAAFQRQLSPWNGAHIQTERAIKDALNDPGSYEHVETSAWPRKNGGYKIMTRFRAKNGYGGVVTERWLSVVDDRGVVLSLDRLD